MKTVMLYNHGGCGNRGCEAIVRSTAALFAREADARAVLASGQAAFDRGVGIPHIERIVSDRIAPYSARRLINSVGFRLGMPREHEVARKHAPVISAGRRADVCLSVGGDTYCYGHQEHLQVINGRLRRAGRPLVLWGCSIDPEIIEGETLQDLRAYELIVARESITAEALSAAGLPVMRWCDPAFTMETQAPEALPAGWREGATVGVNISPLILSRARDGEQALSAFAALIDHILKSSEDAVALVPHVTWALDDDTQALRRLVARFEGEPRVFMLPGGLNAPQYKGYIAQMKALVTARTHASIAGYSSGVPTLVIGYSVKARGIAKDLFGEERGHLIPVQELRGAQELMEAYDGLIARAGQERALLAQRLPQYMAGQKEIVGAVMALAR